MEILASIVAFIIAITFHEAAHAWMADKLGDPTARLMGRLSLNPIVHYDPIGTSILLILVILHAFHFPVIPFGWAKPVRFDPYNLKYPRRDSALIALAGPVSNLLIAVIASILIRLAIAPFSPFGMLTIFLLPLIYLNVLLAVFNLLPIHPLDGGKIFIALLPAREAADADLFLNRYGMIILFFLIFASVNGSSPLTAFLGPLLNLILGILLPGPALI
ncbi:site-2 protease family protein [Candidatus Woesebacteria bacterium]|nr:MAG: site-2 protease family protein [Candidatus Woesebacteria bacterium]